MSACPLLAPTGYDWDMRITADEARGDLAACLGRIDYGRALMRELLMAGGRSDVPYSAALLDAVAMFERLGIGYALAGGIAAMYYGRARFTENVEFVAASGHREILERNPEVIREFHFDPSCTWKLYHESGTDVDIWKDEFADDLVSRACSAKMAGREVRTVEVHDLVAMKLRAGRMQDEYDIFEIIRHVHLNEDLIERYVTAQHRATFRRIAERAELEGK